MGDYLIKKGDNLIKIAKANGTTVDTLLKYNPKLQKNKHLIFAGEKIKLPPKSAEDVDMNVVGMTVERTGNNKTTQKAQSAKTAQTQASAKPEQKPKPATPAKTAKTSLASKQERDTALVAYIIDQDKMKHQMDSVKMTQRIVNAANYAGIKPENLAAIVKQESHFNPQIIISSNGKGPAGITRICPADLYARPQVFDKELAGILKNYDGKLSNLFKAKKANPNLYIGNLGEILYKYKNKDNLYSAVQRDFDLNLKVGAYNYKMALYENKGDEKKAFSRYNASTKSRRAKYARDTMQTVNAARSASPATLNNSVQNIMDISDTHRA